MVRSTVIVTVVGLFILGSGLLGLSGKALRMGSNSFMGNFTAQALCGVTVLGLVLVTSLGEGSPVAAVLIVPVVAALFLGLWSLFVRPPRWLQPAWQREIDDAERRSR